MNSLSAAPYPYPRYPSGALPDAGHEKSDALLCFLLCVYLATLVFEGPLRFGLMLAGAPNLLYARDLILGGSLAWLFARGVLLDGWIDPLVVLPVLVLAAHAAISLFFGMSAFQVLFGLKIFLPVACGIALWPIVRRRFGGTLRVASWLYAITLLGVALNFFLGRFPWEGLQYSNAFTVVATTREWWSTGGLPRLPGFTRASFSAAMILGIAGAVTMVRLRALRYRLAVAALTLAAIALTTSKGMVLAFSLAALWLLWTDGRRKALLGRAIVYAMCALTLLLPCAVILLDTGGGTPPEGLPTLLLSAWERFALGWPAVTSLLPDGPAGVLGAGLGGIGTPQLFGDTPQRLNPADNLAIFLIVNFGVLGVLYYLVPALALHRVAPRGESRPAATAYTAVVFIGYAYGMSINMVEDSFFAISIGLCLGSALLALAGEDRPAATANRDE